MSNVRDSATRVRELLGQAVELHRQGRIAAAKSRNDIALALARKHLSPTDHDYAAAIINAADFHLDDANYAFAERMLLEYLDVLENAGADKGRPYFSARSILTNLYVRSRQFARAETLALADAENPSADGSHAVTSRFLLIQIYVATERLEAAKQQLDTLAALRDSAPPDSFTAKELSEAVDKARDFLEKSAPRVADDFERPLTDAEFAEGCSKSLDLFVRREYDRASYLALTMLVRRTNMLLVEIHLVGLIFQGEDPTRDAARALAVARGRKWESQLIEFTVGRVSLDAALQLATDAEQQSLTLFFAGMLALHRRDVSGARNLFDRSARAQPDSILGRLASREIAAIDFAGGGQRHSAEADHELLETAYGAFAAFDYGAFLTVASTLFESTVCPPEIVVLHVVAADALGARAEIEGLADASRMLLGHYPWHAQMIDHVLGDEPSQVYLDRASSALERCQANYYAACRARLRYHWDEACVFLDAALAFDGSCAERRLAELADADPPRAFTSLAMLAKVHAGRGPWRIAEDAARGALSYAARTGAGSRTDTATALSVLAVTLVQRGEYVEAFDRFRELSPLVSELPEEDRLALLVNLGHTYSEVGDFARARAILTQAFELDWHAAKPEVRAHLLNTLGLVELTHEGPAAALSRFESALAELEALSGDEADSSTALLRAIVEDNAGIASYAAGDFERAFDRHSRAHRALQVLGGATPSAQVAQSIMKNLTNLTTALLSLGRFEESERHAREAVVLAEKAPGAASEAHVALAFALWARERPGEAMEDLLRALALRDATIGEIMALGQNISSSLLSSQAQFDLSLLVSIAQAGPRDDQQTLRRIFGYILRRKALTAEIALVQRDTAAKRYSSLQPLLQELTTIRAVLASTLLTDDADAMAVAKVSALQERQSEIEATLSREMPELRLTRLMRDISAEEILDRVPMNSAVVEYLRLPVLSPPRRNAAPTTSDRRYWAIVLRPGRDQQLTLLDLGPAEDIDELVGHARSAVIAEFEANDAAGEDRVQQESVWARIRELVFDPVALQLRDGIRHVIIAPDGALARVPFAALPVGDDDYVLDSYTISYVGTSRDLLRQTPAGTTGSSDAVVIADPDYDLGVDYADALAPRLMFQRLEGTAQEGRSIADLLGVASWMGKEVLKSRLLAVSSPHILHIATHGFSDAEGEAAAFPDTMRGTPFHLSMGQSVSPAASNPLWRSGLALAGANRDLQRSAFDGPSSVAIPDGLLTAAEVLGMNLRETELVVLSACDTGLGPIHATEGVIGLRRAFLLAGARSVLVSLWKVDDDLTCEFMMSFYQRLLTGIPRAEALTAVQLAFRKNHPPSVWAAFVCFGAVGSVAALPPRYSGSYTVTVTRRS